MKRSIQLLLATLVALPAIPTAQCERARILPEGAAQGIGLGSAVAVDGGRVALVAANSREVWIHTLDERHAYLDERIAAPLSAIGFGNSIDLSGNTLVVGAPFEGDGFVYVYEDLGSGFQRVAKLSAAPRTTGGQFGWSVSIDGGRIAIGEPLAGSGTFRRGAVTILDRVAGVWTRTARIQGESTREDDEFGRSVSLDGNRLAVGAPFLPLGALRLRAGTVFIFDLAQGLWSESARLIPASAQTGDGVGAAIDLQGDAVLIGANNYTNSRGDLYVFRIQNGVWKETGHIAPESNSLEGFGTSVALSSDGRLVAAGTPGEGADSGRVRIYRQSDSRWAHLRTLTPRDAEPDAFFGGAVDIDGSDLVVGARSSNGAFLDAGAAYAFDLSGALCRSLEASPAKLSMSAGGPQTLFLDAGALHAGATFVIAGSAAGESPGSQFGGRRVPLNFDLYSTLTLDPNQTWLTNQTGSLDANGQAAAILNVPPGLPLSMPGQVLHHAFVLQDTSGAYYTSNVTRVRLMP